MSSDFPRTDFAQRSVDLSEFVTYGRKDSIPPIDNPSFALVADIGDIGELEPVVSFGIDGDFRAYPLRGYCQIKINCYSICADLGLVSIIDVWRKPIKYRDLPI